ncbi:unnamed protein product [Mytilus coruscus]|uniref:Retrotransposon gag domain-containing protein n=1 Tax=Mytilus coruscus TaxID=42192 RepID=A0A6J8E5F2_MYTCO|nr:unnamed protein product [Mytilus coruscus]
MALCNKDSLNVTLNSTQLIMRTCGYQIPTLCFLIAFETTKNRSNQEEEKNRRSRKTYTTLYTMFRRCEKLRRYKEQTTVPFNNNLDDDTSSVLNDSFIEENEFPDLDQSESSVVIAPIIDYVSTPSSKCETTPQPFNILATVPDTPVPLPKFPKLLTMDTFAKCSTFSGYPQDNAKRFLAEFESYALLRDLAEEDKRRIVAFHLHLKGPALTWFNSLSDESKQSWQNIYVLFKEKIHKF